MGKSLTLILGGARSGKSTYAQRIMEESGAAVLFVATAAAGDAEMAARIKAHQASRPAGWKTLEAHRGVGRAIQAMASNGNVLLDCLTLLASNVLMACSQPLDELDYQAALQREMDELLAAYHIHSGDWIMVSNEVGLGLVPPTALGRIYRDALGRVNQQLAQAADHVIFMTASIPMKIK